MAVREKRGVWLAREIACLGKKIGSRAMSCSFLFSLVIHTLFLLYAGHPTFRQCLDRRIKVDLVHLKAPVPLASVPLKASVPQRPPQDTPPNPHTKDIHRAYVRSKRIPKTVSQCPKPVSQFSQTQEVKIPTKYQSIDPGFSHPQATPLSKPLTEQKATGGRDVPQDRAQDTPQDTPQDISQGMPTPQERSQERPERLAGEIPVPSSGPLGASVASVAGQIAGAAGQIKGGSLSGNLPMKIKAASDGVDPALAYQGAYQGGGYQGYQEAIRRYHKAIRQHIESYKKFPSLARKRGWEGVVIVRFLLRRDGQVEQIRVTRSSAIALLDEAAIRAVKDGDPFPPFPEGIRESSLWFEVPLVFELREKSG